MNIFLHNKSKRLYKLRFRGTITNSSRMIFFLLCNLLIRMSESHFRIFYFKSKDTSLKDLNVYLLLNSRFTRRTIARSTIMQREAVILSILMHKHYFWAPVELTYASAFLVEVDVEQPPSVVSWPMMFFHRVPIEVLTPLVLMLRLF